MHIERILELGLGVDDDRSQFDMTAFSPAPVEPRQCRSASSTRRPPTRPGSAILAQPILGITNGVHVPRWIGNADARAARGSGADLDQLDDDAAQRRFWERIERIPDERPVGRRTCEQKLELAIFARGRLRIQFARHGEAPGELEEWRASSTRRS